MEKIKPEHYRNAMKKVAPIKKNFSAAYNLKYYPWKVHKKSLITVLKPLPRINYVRIPLASTDWKKAMLVKI